MISINYWSQFFISDPEAKKAVPTSNALIASLLENILTVKIGDLIDGLQGDYIMK